MAVRHSNAAHHCLMWWWTEWVMQVKGLARQKLHTNVSIHVENNESYQIMYWLYSLSLPLLSLPDIQYPSVMQPVVTQTRGASHLCVLGWQPLPFSHLFAELI